MNYKIQQTILFVRTYKNQILTAFSAVLLIVLVAGTYWAQKELTWMHSQIQNHEWKIPSTIYAEAPTLYAGKNVSVEWCAKYLENLEYLQTKDLVLKPGQFAIRKEGLVFYARQSIHQTKNSAILIEFNKNGIKRLIELKSGDEIPRAMLEPVALADLYGKRWEKQKLLKLQDLPPYIPRAVLAIEDRRFYVHSGVDPRSITRAALNNFFGDGRVQGGSTITQQVVKNFYLTPKKSLRRKAKEAVMALMMEQKYDKNKILEFYLNDVYMGKYGSMNVRGFEEASRLYFKKDARYMSLPEAALLAGMIQAPLRYDPYRHPEKAKERRDTVLRAMKNTQAISPEEYAKYISSPIQVNPVDEKLIQAPYFVQTVIKNLPEQYSEKDVHTAGYQIYTTLDMNLQRIAEESLYKGLDQIDKYRFKKTRKHIQGCLIAVEPSTGKIRAFVGGRSFSDSQFDRVTQAKRQPGSSFKPFVYAAALDSAYDPTVPFYTPATLIPDEPFSVKVHEGVWEPENYNEAYHGMVTAREALARSMNIATARLAQDFGLEKIAKLSQQLGLEDAKPYPSLSLGAFEVTPWELISAYTIFPNNGTKVEVNAVRAITDANGKQVYEAQVEKKSVMHEQTAYLVTDMLKSVVQFGTGAGIRKYGLTGAIAGKTGTSNDKRDAWFVGFTPQLMCLVWVGYDDNTPMGLLGGEAALPIWASFMKRALPANSEVDFKKPPETVERMIDPTTGKLASSYCYYSVREIFIAGTEPKEVCTYEDHELPPESFAGPKLRTASVAPPKLNHEQQLDQSIYDAPVESYNESESADGFIYFAAPEKEEQAEDDDPPQF
jgi:penicillin-binding protein 1B